MTEIVIHQRFVDVDQEPNKRLTPITDFENSALVSLEDAIEPIKFLLHDADIMVEIAKINSEQPSDGLTQDESASIYLYTMQWPQPHPSLSTLLNENIRSNNRSLLTIWFLYLKLFFTALYKLPSIKCVIYRGIRGNLSNKYNNNDCFWRGFSSCIDKMNVMKDFIGNDGDRTIFIIECLNGKSIRSHSCFQNVNEIILLPGNFFKIISKCDEGNGLNMLLLKQQQPPYGIFSLAENQLILENINPVSFLSRRTIFEKWEQVGKTVAGGNGRGEELNQLNEPRGIFIDKNKNIFIVDTQNCRIVQWKKDANEGIVVAGENGVGNRIDQLNCPLDVIVDEENNSLIIADCGNKRVIRWSLNQTQQEQEVLIDDIECCSLTMDKYRYLYVCDFDKNEVKRWRIEETRREGTLVAGGNGKGDQLNQLNDPSFIFVDDQQSVYVSDPENHRVMKWKKDANEGIIVAGGNGEGLNLNQLSYPTSLIADDFGQIYVADFENDRIMRWGEENKAFTRRIDESDLVYTMYRERIKKMLLISDIIVGKNGRGNELYQLNGPNGLSFDCEGHLYVTDWGNDRIQRFDLI